MRKIFTLMTLLLALVMSHAYAGDVFTVDFNGSETTQSVDGYFTVAGKTGTSNNTSKIGTTQYSSALKFDNSGSISFTSTDECSVTIYQSLTKNEGKVINFDGTNAAKSDRVDDTENKVGTYTYTKVAAGTHTIKKGDGETGILRVEVEYTGSESTQLNDPVITFNPTTKLVTITQAENAAVYYTTDGTTPSATNGTKYTEPFAATLGTTVKAIAVSDATSTTDSDVEPFFLNATATISQSGFGTFCSSLPCKLPEGLTAYVVAMNDAMTVATLTPVKGSVIPSETGVVLKGTAGQTYTMDVEANESGVSAEDEETFNNNALYAVVAESKNTATAVYVLICNDQKQAQFALLKSGETIPAGKAVLWLDDDDEAIKASTLRIDFSAVTAIDAATVDKSAADAAYYTLDGRKLAERPQHGAYIHAGKVYIVK